jgi:DNA (cytosine-5)-methyltransferase 1
MAEITAVLRNGYRAVSTFSGCGGSCLGYRMAGFEMLWASEFIPAAQEVYRLNHPDSILDTRDIREVQPVDILEAIGLDVGETDLLDGSPPCAPFSTAGKRNVGWGKVKAYSDTKQRVDDLFFEFARILKGLQPKVFVAENVSGLVKGVAKGYFKLILKELKECGYTVSARLLDAQWLGVPQMRQRIIFVGVRNDLVERFGVMPAHPQPLGYQYTVREAIPWITAVEGANGFNGHQYKNSDIPAATVQQSRPVKAEARISAHKGGRSIDEPAPSVLTHGRQYTTSELMIVEPETDISRYAIGSEWERMGKPGTQSEKYFQLTRAPLDGQSGAITQRGSDNTVASVTHPTEKRKFSIAELKRICAFPDDFQLTGTYAQQWERLGRAVPPVMMFHVAKTIQEKILDRCKP